jgi:hypothetical protein
MRRAHVLLAISLIASGISISAASASPAVASAESYDQLYREYAPRYNHHDPDEGCAYTGDTVLLREEPIGDEAHGLVQLWYSRTCRTAWTRGVWPAGIPASYTAISAHIHRPGDGDFKNTAPATIIWSPMVVADQGECVEGHIAIERPNGEVFLSPEIEDCS